MTEKKEKHWLDYLLAFIAACSAGTVAFSANQAKHQLEESKAQLAAVKADQRPWISLDVLPAGPLSHDNHGWAFPFTYKIQNVGKSVATNVTFFYRMVPVVPPLDRDPGLGFVYKPAEPTAQTVDTVCADASGSVKDGFGDIVFPGEKWGGPDTARSNAPGNGYFPGFVLVTCATYSFSGEIGVHKTMRAYLLTASGALATIHIDHDGPYPQPFSFIRHPIHGATAA